MKFLADREITSGLALRLATMILVALLPLGLLALVQTRTTMRQADETRLAASVGHTLQDALREIRLIRASQVTAQLLASTLDSTLPDCADQAAAYATTDGRIARAGFVPADGHLRCSSDGQSQDFAQSPRFAGILASSEPRIFYDPEWSRPGESELSLTWPVIGPQGQPLGFILLSLPEAALLAISRGPDSTSPRGSARPEIMIALNGKGEMVYASTGVATATQHLPEETGVAALLASDATGFFDSDQSGKRRIFAWVPINNDLYLLGVWPLPGQDHFFNRQIMPWLFPALMWLAGVGVTILGVERLVTRHIRRLSRAMRDFTSENRLSGELALDHPPAEIASLAEAYRTLTATILRDEAELENLLRQKAGLLREVHHRTGNSLQLIASFLRMHRRETEDEAIRAVLDDLHNRVMSLSSVHLGLYRMAGGTEVAVDLLMAEVIAKVDLIHGRAGRKSLVQADLMPLMLPSQQAVPLALLLAEILSCFPPAGAEREPVHIRLSHGPYPPPPGPDDHQPQEAATEDQRFVAQLEVSGAVAAFGRLTGAHSGAPAVIGARLIRGFVTQLPGELKIIEEGSRVRAVVTFTCEPLEQQAPDQAQPPARQQNA